jgi:hypothetical protein
MRWITEEQFWEVAFGPKNRCMWRRLQEFFQDHTSSLELKVYLIVAGHCGGPPVARTL